MDVTGRVALVTGGARRVGRAISLGLADIGCDLAIHYHRSENEASTLAHEVRQRGCRAILVQGDLGEPRVASRIVDEAASGLGGLDILVNNASVFESLSVEDWTEGHWEHTLRVNLIAPAALAGAAIPLMRHGGWGRIINLTDILADRPIKRFAAYCASKAALVSLTKSLARELAPQITVNAVAPGIAVFPDDYSPALREKLTGHVPLGRAGTPVEVAALVAFLVRDGGYITGQVIPVDGGRSIVP